MSAGVQTKVQAGPAQSFTPAGTGLLQRKYTLCNIPRLVEDSERDKEKLTLQRSSVDQAEPSAVPPIVHEVLHSPGQPLDPETRAFMEPRLGHDFSGVSILNTVPTMVQRKLTIGQPNDRYEQEADRVADEVMRMPEPQVQRQVEPEEEEEEEMLQTKPLASQITPLVQVQRQEQSEEEVETLQAKLLADQITPLVRRQIEPNEEDEWPLVYDMEPTRNAGELEEEEEPIQSKLLNHKTPQVTRDLQSKIQSLEGGGHPLNTSTRTFFESRFGRDLSKVRVHSSSFASELAMSLDAKAFTKGKDIVFGAKQYSPETSSGKHLLAHELVHSIQQGIANPVNNESKSAISVQELHAKQIIQRSPLSENLESLRDEQDRTGFWGRVRSLGSCHDPEALYIIEQELRTNPPRDVTRIRTSLGTASIAAGLSVPAGVDQALVIAITRATQVHGGPQTRNGIRDILQHAIMDCSTLQYFHRQFSTRTLGHDFGINYSRRYLERTLIPGLDRRISACTRPTETEAEQPRETEPESPAPTPPAAATPEGVNLAQVQAIRDAIATFRGSPGQNLQALIQTCHGLDMATAEYVHTEIYPGIRSGFGARVYQPIETELQRQINGHGTILLTHSPALTTPGREGDPRTTFYSHTISISESRGPSPAPQQIRYMIEYNRFHRGEQGAYVLYIQNVTADAGCGNQRFSYQDYLSIGSSYTVVPEREDIVLRYVWANIFGSDYSVESEEPMSYYLNSRNTIRGTRAYEIINPNDLDTTIRTHLNRSWSPETSVAPHEQMPGGQSPEEYSLAEYTDERHEAAMAWLESEYGSTVRAHGEDFELHGLYHLDYDTVRLARGRQNWIVDFRRSLIDSSRAPRRPETRGLLDFHRSQEGQPVQPGTEAAAQLRPLLRVEGVGDHTVLHLWENEFLANYGTWTRIRQDTLAALLGNRMGCGRRQVVARRLIDQVAAQMQAQSADASTVQPHQRDQVPTVEADRLAFAERLRTRLQLQGPPDQVIIEFWEHLTAPQEVEDYIEDLNQLGLVRSYMHQLRYPGQRPSELSNPRAIRINDFSHYNAGVDLHSARGNLWNHMFRVHAVDPQFFATILQFCRALHAIGVRRLYTAGHYRDPLSPRDTHSSGRAIDITGFGFGASHNLILSNDDAQTAWNDTVNLLPDGRTYREAMLEISQLMSRYFSWIGGPGRDQSHNNHFHCEISRGGGERFQYLPSTPLDPHPETRR